MPDKVRLGFIGLGNIVGSHLPHLNRRDDVEMVAFCDVMADRAEARVLLGDLLRAEGQTESALEHYRQALRSQPDLSRAHLSLGLALVNTGDEEPGVVHLRRAAQGNDDSARKEALDALRQIGAL